ncbi:radical SAM protein [bacterium]|nr:radical SAM protein [Candidatus Omnitrophota bacterium]MBA3065837.1 radical SAM protein [bacterium]MBU4122139.1 radical SAM protein [bacterium]
MKLNFVFAGLKALFCLKIQRKNYPLALRWQLLDRCGNRCRYCALWKNPRPEMELTEIKEILRQAGKAGTARISFSGGEPLLRDDIGEIIKYAKGLNISCSMNTRGALIEKRKDALQNLDMIKISIDGSEPTHDYISGRKGAFEQSYNALRICVEMGIKTVITTTITKYNLNDIDFIAGLAEKFGVLAAFQPFKLMYKGSKDSELCPDEKRYKEAVDKLIKLKKEGFPFLRNSLSSLRHIRNYPCFPGVKCAAGKLFAVIDVDGTLLPCDRNDGEFFGELPNVREGFLKAFRKLPEYSCSGCGFLGARELSYFMGMNFEGMESVKNILSAEKRAKNEP